MLRTNSFSFTRVLLVFLLMFGVFWKHCDSQVNREHNREEANKPPDGHGGDDGAFFALRSCHQLLHDDSGEFFSPDYLCSNPPLWCNWTIQVDPGKRVHLHLEDMTPDDACHLKQDQVHVDEPTGHFSVLKILQKCWREAKYTSSSSTLYVTLLIGGWPSPPYRGFYGRYQAFGPPVVYNPLEGLAERNRKSEPSHGLVDVNEFEMDMNVEQTESPANSDLMYDYRGQPSAMMDELQWDPEEAADSDSEVGEIHPVTAAPTGPASTQGTSRLGRGAVRTPSGQADSAGRPASPQQHPDGQDQEPEASTRTPTAVPSVVGEASTPPEDESSTQSLSEWGRSAHDEDLTAEELTYRHRGGGFQHEADETAKTDQLPAPSERPEPEETEQTRPHPNMVEPLSDHRGNINIRNHSETPHLPGGHLFEVAVEVNLSSHLESWDSRARLLLLSVKALISEQLEALQTPLSIFSKRIKRLNAGVLYILWLQIGQGPGGPQVHRAVHLALHDLIAAGVGENHEEAVITSVSTADVNECGTQLVLCDVNADCVNHFGSYSCHCRPGFRDESRLGSGGTLCVEVKAAGCSSGLSAETKGVYALFFLLGSVLLLLLLVAAGLLYRRRHQGAFLVRCSRSPPDPNNNTTTTNHHHHHHYDDADLLPPPPPPPTRGFREGWPQVKERRPAGDLPLLRFSALLPPDACTEPQDGGRT